MTAASPRPLNVRKIRTKQKELAAVASHSPWTNVSVPHCLSAVQVPRHDNAPPPSPPPPPPGTIKPTNSLTDPRVVSLSSSFNDIKTPGRDSWELGRTAAAAADSSALWRQVHIKITRRGGPEHNGQTAVAAAAAACA